MQRFCAIVCSAIKKADIFRRFISPHPWNILRMYIYYTQKRSSEAISKESGNTARLTGDRLAGWPLHWPSQSFEGKTHRA